MDWRQFHDFTNHRPDLPGGRSDDPGRPQPMDPGRKPEPFKDYAEELPLIPLVDARDRWISKGGARADLFDLEELSRLLLIGAGAKRFKKGPLSGRYFRTYASAGALHPNEVYVAPGALEGLPSGLYHFNPRENHLALLGEGDARVELSEASGEARLADAQAVLIISGIPWRTSWKYGPRGYRHLWWDAGMIIANLLALAAEAGNRCRVLVNFVDRVVNEMIGVDGHSEMALALVAIGSGAVGSNPDFNPRPAIAAPISSDPYEYSVITEVHKSTSIASADEITAEAKAFTKDVESLEVHEPLERLIWRRGSTRRFDPEPIESSVLREVLAYASSPLDCDWDRPVNELFVIASGVDRLASGSYRWSAEDLEMIAIDEEAKETAQFLSLNQDLGGDAAAVIFPMADLDEAQEKLGPRGYRAVQLDGAIASGRIYLASFAAGLGATGLTFYDEEVQKCFGSHRLPMLEVAIGKRAARVPPPVPGKAPTNLDLTQGQNDDGIPEGWLGRVRGYSVRVGEGVLEVESTSKRPQMAYVGQLIQSEQFSGGKVKFSADLSVDCEEGSAGALFLNVTGTNGLIAYDNMRDRPITGRRDFETYSLELDVPPEARQIMFAILIEGRGKIRAKEFQVVRV